MFLVYNVLRLQYMYETILIVEDDPVQLQQLQSLLTESGFYVVTAGDYESAEQAIVREKVGLLLLDLRLGDKNGMDILRLVKRQNVDFPVIILSSVSEIEEKVSAFEIGVDDYITKPYHPAELVLRIKRLLKSSERSGWSAETTVQLGESELDMMNGVVRCNNREVFLRRKVLDLLLLFFNNRNQLLSKDHILKKIWEDNMVDENVVSVTIHEIRQAIERDPKNPKVLVTVKGRGYKLVV